MEYFQEEPLFFFCEVVIEHFPQPGDDAVVVVKSAVVLRVFAQIFEVDRFLIIGDQPLDLLSIDYY